MRPLAAGELQVLRAGDATAGTYTWVPVPDPGARTTQTRHQVPGAKVAVFNTFTMREGAGRVPSGAGLAATEGEAGPSSWCRRRPHRSRRARRPARSGCGRRIVIRTESAKSGIAGLAWW